MTSRPPYYDPEALSTLGHEYVETLRKLWPQAARVTDKMPSNFLVAGLVHMALPKARIIHLRRNPADNALSIWTTPNKPVSDGGHDKRSLVRVFEEYFRLMAHLRSVLPPDRFLEIDYEEIVSDQDGATRRMVEFCGLEWDEACLRPENNPRPVLTPSVWQVRQPVYRSSVERWRRFEPWLGPLKALVGEDPTTIRIANEKESVASAANVLREARSQIARQNYSEAERLLRDCTSAEPENAAAQELLGSVLKVLGRFEEADEAFQSALRLNPARKGLLYDLVTTRRLGESDAWLVEGLTQALAQKPANPEEAIRLHFGLGKAYEDLGQYEEAISQYEAGHAVALADLKSRGQEFNPAECAARFDSIIKTFSAERLKSARGGSWSDLPLLVVGMVRSGTTLVEQILACHSQVAAGGELTFWPENWQRVHTKGPGFDSATLKQVSENYLGLLKAIGPGAKRVTDKMPGNYIALGAIHAALPHARTIVCRRDPLDTAISIFATPIQSAHTWIHRREDIVFFFGQYERLMAHWREVLPNEVMLQASYEELATEPEKATRGLLKFAGLEWQDACLNPERHERAVTTPSQWQVRQPIYATSVDRWRRFEPWLGALSQLRK